MLAPTSPIPSIEISLAPPEEIPAEPYSPFNTISFPTSDDLDSPRSMHLLPPPAVSPHRNSPREPSPLGPSAAKILGKGLDPTRFESMLRATRERAATKRTIDLRKEVALKAHNNKAAERRAIFLSKIEAPPSPSATVIPATPPDSPAVLHYSLPSPGLESPISLFETIVADQMSNDDARRNWIEQIDFQSVSQEWEQKQARKAAILQPRTPRALPPKSLPSLDQISARMNSQHAARGEPRKSRAVTKLPIGAGPVAAPTARAPIPLPAFLRTRTPAVSSHPDPTSPAAPARLPLPELLSKAPTPPPAPHPKFNPTTIIISGPPPASGTQAPAASEATPLTAANLSLLDSRTERGKAMLEKIMRRVSSPAELERAGKRTGEVFGEHKVLKMPGGF